MGIIQNTLEQGLIYAIMALGVLLTLTGGLATLPLPALVLYQAAWCVLAMIFPLFQRY